MARRAAANSLDLLLAEAERNRRWLSRSPSSSTPPRNSSISRNGTWTSWADGAVAGTLGLEDAWIPLRLRYGKDGITVQVGELDPLVVAKQGLELDGAFGLFFETKGAVPRQGRFRNFAAPVHDGT